MKKLIFLSVGRTSKPFIREGVNEYKKRLSSAYEISEVELPEGKSIASESAELIKHMRGFCVLFDLKGKPYSSVQYADILQNAFYTNDYVTVIIGGSDGVDDFVRGKANAVVSFSNMTFPHQLAKLLALEQTYRAYTILNNMPYHK